MGWLGSWAYRIPIKYGSTRPGSSLTAYPELVEFDLPRIRSEYSLAGGGRPSMAVTLSDGTTTVAFGVIAFAAGGAGQSMAAGTATASNDTITITSHGLQAGWTVYWQANAPSGLAINTQYYVVSPTTNTFKVSDTSGGAAKDITADGSFSLGDLQLQTSAVTFRFQLTKLSSASTGDVEGYLYVDHTQTDQENKSGVLDANTVAYWPLEESPDNTSGQIKDWTGVNNGTSVNTPTSAAAEVANGISFNGTNQEITVGSDASLNITSAITISAWIKVPSGQVDGIILNGYQLSGSFNGYGFASSIGSNQKINYWDGGQTGAWVAGSTAVNDNTWRHVAVVVSGTTASFYMNGAADGTASAHTPNSYAGSRQIAYQGSVFWAGTLDEFRVSATARSPDWIAYEHTNEASNSSTVTAGTEETLAADTLLGQICL